MSLYDSCLSKRRGVALVLALVVVLVGGALIALIFEMTVRFGFTSLRQGTTYSDHLEVTGYIESAKGFIADTNVNNDQVMHPKGYTNIETTLITSLDMLMFDQAELSVDRVFAGSKGRQRVVMRVFDANYRANRVREPLLLNSVDMAQMPPPLSLAEAGASMDQYITNVGNSHTPTTGGQAIDDNEVWKRFFKYYGAYLIRVELYDIDESGTQNLTRKVEEAFFQVISQDL